MEKSFIKSFDGYINENKDEKDIDAVVPTATSKTVSKAMAERIKTAAELTAELKKLSDEFKKNTDPIKSQLNKLDSEVLELMNQMDASMLIVDKVIAKLDVTKGTISESYKGLFEYALGKHNTATQGVINEYRLANKRYNADKIAVKYETNEAVKDIIGAITGWLKSFWDKMSVKSTEYIESAKVLNDLVKVSKI
jgi:hypothetical protein